MNKNKIHFWQNGLFEIIEGEGMPEFPYHTHNSILIGVIKKGEAAFEIGKDKCILSDAMTYLIPSNVGISIKPVTPYSYLTICLKGEMKEYFEKYNLKNVVYHSVGDRIIQLCEQFRSDRKAGIFLKNLIETLELHTDKSNVDEKNEYNYIVETTTKYIHEHIKDKFNLDQVAKEVHVTKYHLDRTFKKKMGITPKQYALQCKIRYIKEYDLTEHSELEIAMDMNFAAQSHLCSVFKKYMGISMKDYKRSIDRIEQ